MFVNNKGEFCLAMFVGATLRDRSRMDIICSKVPVCQLEIKAQNCVYPT